MSVLLIIDRATPPLGIMAMLWSADSDDPRLLESKHFKGQAALKVWLAGIATRYGRGNITVKWTDLLKADETLAAAIRETIDQPSPGS